ncbi:MAG: hypothetical protein CM1200mP28_14220 [Deltaproteobacteria bacterium]|nr:MAG: hypothetical protein CM1200mP28_14220 [Deltaproteobacteria bacterium]
MPQECMVLTDLEVMEGFESTVFGGIAGDTIAEYMPEFRECTIQDSQISEIIESTLKPFKHKQSASIYSYVIV